MPGKQLLVAVLLGNLESPSAYRFEREWAGCRWEEPGREPGRGRGGGGRYQRPQRYRTAGAGPGVRSRRGANLREILSRVTHKFPSAEPSPKTRRGAGEGEHTGTRPCPAEAWEPWAWPPPHLAVTAAAPVPSAAPLSAGRTLTPLRPGGRSRPPQPPARTPPPQRGQQPRALSASGLGRAHRCARPFPPQPRPPG